MGVLRLLPASDFRRMPWKNGGGETVEVAVFPPDTGLDAFDWRISMATVAADGPFSLFPGIDRTLSVLTGAGIALAIDGASPVQLKPGDAPLSFPADVPVDAVLIDGPIVDLNVMTRRGRFRHRVNRYRVEGTAVLHFDGLPAVLLLQDGDVCVDCGGETIGVAAGDALSVEAGVGHRVSLAADLPVVLHAVELCRSR